MKVKLLAKILMIGLIAQFVVVSSAGSTNLFASQDIDFGIAPLEMMEADLSNFPQDSGNTPGSIDSWNADLVNTELVSETGEGVYVAVLDTGLLPNWPTFFPNHNIAWDLGVGFTHDFYWDDDVNDVMLGPLRSDRGFITDLASGHGTHVTSTIVGYDFFGFPISGIAPHATIIPVLVLDAWLVDSPFGLLGFSGGTNEMIAAGINYVADLTDTLDGKVVINMSLGGPTRSSLIEAAVDYAISKGVIIVASAGNNGEDGMGYPGALPQVISAASVGWTGTFIEGWTGDVPEDLREVDALGNNHQLYLSDFSSRPDNKQGQKSHDLDVAAPGSWVVGPYKSTFQNNVGYYYLSGTSMAAPHVAGMAALVLQSYPDVDQATMEFILKNAAHGNPLPADGTWDYVPFYVDPFVFHSWKGNDYGSGFLTADAALAAAANHA